ncbi:MAG: hypothetical protein VX278_05020 [Myxococcota bacterium]|nr:hypothetical protein [Myxococcota bacterium]
MKTWKRQRRRSGVGILLAIAIVAILTVLVTEIIYTARIRMLTAYHQAERSKAYWLAKSGVNIYVLILAANKELGKNSMIQQFGLGDSLWQMVPVINTGLMRMLFVRPSDISEEDKENLQNQKAMSEDLAEASREGGLIGRKNFLDFHGDFSAEIRDNEGRIDLNQLATETGALQDGLTAQRIFALMSGEENDAWFLERNLDRWEMIGNIRDWVDTDNMRSGGLGGNEDSLYDRRAPAHFSKNAKFDSLKELRVVEGWQGELYEKFAEQFTIWSNGKFNLNSFDDDMHKAMIRSTALSQPTDATLDMCMNAGGEGVLSMWDVTTFNNANDYATFIQNNCGIELDKNKLKNISSTSKVFTIRSTGMVGNSVVTITTVIDYTRRSTGEVKYWRIE